MPNKAVALALSTHPGPALAVTAITALLGAGLGFDPGRLTLLGLMMLANQASVGLSNDWIDAERDRAVGRTDKPIARGWVSAPAVRTAAFATAAASVLLSLPLGAGTLATNLLFIASAWAYNAWLKRSVFSILPYIVSFGVLPLIVTLAGVRPAAAAWWALIAGALLGVAAHIANVLPDLDDDRRTGVQGFAHRLGRRVAGVTTYASLTVASAFVVFGPGGTPDIAGWTGLGLTVVIAVIGISLAITRPPSRLLFQLILGAAVINVALLALSGSKLLA
ncbi:UbiA family prenyltransferase [Glaciihabitans sp. dw_435]|uniref:UbiA family prenyltransferase n=1 Tax=Glaciihabitans sp. dw_435 TaxID=2720081 RepID=UPI001BD566CA|nr:UbiA family prenyltransferase [Glaciihabitans sp. dw_435]